MENGNIQTTYHPLDSLIFAEYNPRQLTKEQHKQLKDSITRFGLVDPIIINKHPARDNIIIGGHQRAKIAEELGLKEIPCVELKLTLEKEKELNIRLNKNVGEWDYDALANHFDVGELTDWGFSEDDLQFYETEEVTGLIDDDEVPEVEEAVTKSGDLWLLGEHRVLCGDATKKADVEALMDGQKADMVFTDPPYGMNLDTDYSKIMNRGNKYKPVIADDNEWEYEKANHFDCDEQIWWGADYYRRTLPIGGSWYVWDKQISEHDGKSHTGSLFELAWSKTPHKREIKKVTYFRFYGMDTKKRLHPTQKPVELCIWFLEKLSESKKNIIDLFLGSGSTLIACEKTNRKCYGMEIDPHYCDVIVKRWEDYTGKKAKLG